MQKIGQGLQFNVYDAGARVQKVPTSRAQVMRKLLRFYPSMLFRPGALEAKAQRVMAERDTLIRELQVRRLDLSLMGNLHFENGRIWQDKILPLGEALGLHPDPCVLIDCYIDAIHDTWARGYAETSHNFTVNHGIDNGGRIVMMDFGEMTFRKSTVAEAIRTNFWERAWSTTSDLQPDVQAYFLRAMRERVTEAELEARWDSARRILRPAMPSRRPRRVAVGPFASGSVVA